MRSAAALNRMAVASAILAMLLARLLGLVVPTELRAVADLAASLVAVALLMLPAALSGPSVSPWGLAAAVLTGGLLALSVPLLSGAREPAALWGGAVMVSALTIALAGLAWRLGPVTGDGAAAIGWLLLAMVLLTASPLWLAGVLDLWPALADPLVAVNPLTALALPSLTDYPRADWWYRHSPLGSLRYAYPSPVWLTAAYLTLGLGSLFVPRRRATLSPNPAFRRILR